MKHFTVSYRDALNEHSILSCEQPNTLLFGIPISKWKACMLNNGCTDAILNMATGDLFGLYEGESSVPKVKGKNRVFS